MCYGVTCVKMERHVNKRYKRLKVDKRKAQNKNKETVLDQICYKDEENFKIERFMKDVKRFYNNVELDKGHSDGLDLNEDRVKGGTKKEGLFLRGVIPKPFNKGLMPPTLSARLNEDLERMIQWANGRKKKRGDKVSDKKVCKINNSIRSVSDDGNSNKHVSPIKINEIEMQLDYSKENYNTSYKNKNDLYIKFTHYVTKSLFNSGIDKTEVKNYSDSIKESLVDIYYKNKDESTGKLLKNSSPSNSNMHLSPDIRQKTPTKRLKQPINQCPKTSKSEDGPKREKFVLASDSQLSDDVIIRKSNEIMLASGLDYLKAVYSNKSLNNTSDLLNQGTDFSPVIKRDVSMTSLKSNDYSFTVDHYNQSDNDFYKMDSDYQSRHYTNSKDRLNYKDFNRLQTSDDNIEFNQSSLRFFPGNNENLQNNYRSNFSSTYDNTHFQNNSSRNAFVNSEMSNVLYNKSPKQTESPKYVSLLPSPLHHHYCDNLRNNFKTSLNEPTNKVNNNYFRRDTEIESYLSIPVHPPLIKSPDIQFKPRRMF